MKTIEEMRARLGEITSELKALEGVENYTNEELEVISALSDEFETLTKTIEAKEKVASIANKATASTGRKVAPVAQRTEVIPSRKEKNGGFESAGEFFMAVKSAAHNNIDPRFKNTMFERNGDEGGFLVPEDFMTEINKKINGDESLLVKTRQFKTAGNALSIMVDEKSPWNAGVQAYWTEEGGSITESAPSFARASWRLNKLAAMVKATDELLEDAPALESIIKEMAPVAMTHEINKAIISGTGAGKPMGILNSGFKVTVSKEAAQAADTIVAANIVKMYSRMLPSSRANAVWYINAGVEEQLRLMKDEAGNYIYMAPGSQMNQTPYGMLMGRPVIPMLGGMPQLGDEGDIVFADLSYYYTLLKTNGLKSSMSTHLYFDKDQTAFKFTFRIDGACPFNAPVVTEFGNYEMSGIVTLEAR